MIYIIWDIIWYIILYIIYMIDAWDIIICIRYHKYIFAYLRFVYGDACSLHFLKKWKQLRFILVNHSSDLVCLLLVHQSFTSTFRSFPLVDSLGEKTKGSQMFFFCEIGFLIGFPSLVPIICVQPYPITSSDRSHRRPKETWSSWGKTRRPGMRSDLSLGLTWEISEIPIRNLWETYKKPMRNL